MTGISPPENLSLIMELQDHVLSRVGSDMNGVLRFILDNCSDQEEYLSQFIIMGVHYHSHHIDIYVSLVDNLLKMDPLLSLIPALKHECKLSHKRYNDTPCQTSLHRSLYRFIYRLYLAEIFNMGDVMEILSSYITKRSYWEMTNTVSELAPWFGPELALSKEILNLKKLENHLLSFGQDDWKNIKTNRAAPNSYNKMFEAILSDDLAGVKLATGSPETYKIEKSEFDTTWVFPKVNIVTPIYIAARHGSLRCFRHFFLNSVCVDPDQLALAAIAGGNAEIVRLSEQLGSKFTKFIDIIISYHQYDIFDWVCEQLEPSQFEESSVFDAVVSGNVHVLNYIFQNSLYDLHRADSTGMTMLHYAVKFGIEISARYLIEVVKVNTNAQENRRLTALHYAVKTRNAAMTKRLLSYASVDPNIGDESGTTPLHYAVQNADREITNILLACPRIKPYTKNNINNTPAYLASQKQLGDLNTMIRKKIGLMSHTPVLCERPKTAPSRTRSVSIQEPAVMKTKEEILRQRPSTAVIRKQPRPVIKQRTEQNSCQRREQTPKSGRRVHFGAPKSILYCG